jgi:hypothetical protein
MDLIITLEGFSVFDGVDKHRIRYASKLGF